MPNFQNPTSAPMPVDHKQELVALLARHPIPLIEDDACAELHFGPDRPPPAKAFDRHGLVLHCGSFSKSLAPGYRVGWVTAGRFSEAVRRHKSLFSISANPAQAGIAEFVRSGGYELQQRGCDQAPGYLFARALPPDEAASFARRTAAQA